MTRSLLALAALLAFANGAPAQPPHQSPQTFSGQLDIREREVVVALPDNLSGKALRPGDFQVLVRRQLDKLLAFLASRRPAGPHALFLVADGTATAPAGLFEGHGHTDEQGRTRTNKDTRKEPPRGYFRIRPCSQPVARSSPSPWSRIVRRVSPSVLGENGFCRQSGESSPPSESSSSL